MNKLGLHIIGGWRGSLGRARLVKLMDVSTEYVAQVRAEVGPQALIIVRWFQTAQPLDNPAARAQQFVARYQGEMLAMNQLAGPNLAFEGYNEIADSDAAAYAEFEVERLRLMHQLGLHSVVGNWSVGTPDIPVWRTYQPVLDAMWPSDWIGLHEYWPWGIGIDNRWWCGRWTMVPQLAGRRIVVTECGRDIVEGRGQPGWRLSCDAEQYLRDLEAYNDLLERFPNVLGATVFSAGYGWENFDVSEVWPRVVARYSVPQSYPTVTPAPPVTPPPPPYAPEKVAADGVRYVDWYKTPHSCGRGGRRIVAVVVHSPERSPLGSVQSTLNWFANATSKVSAHDVVAQDGTVYRCVGYDRAAWHCGGSTIPGVPTGSVDGTSIVNLATIGVELDHSWTAGDPYPDAQLDAAARHLKALCDRYGITREHVHRHGDIDSRKIDPRDLTGTAWQAFLDRIFPPVSPPEPVPPPAEKTLHERIVEVRWLSEEATRALQASDYDRCRRLLLEQTEKLYALERDTG